MTITWKGSPNFNKGRGSNEIEKIVIHWFGIGTLESANNRFQNPDADVSAHYGISGSKVWQWVKDEDTAWHAGNFKVNQQSIGIEHDATTTKEMSAETYRTSAQLVHDLCIKYDIPFSRDYIVGHNESSATQCPGTIDIDKIIRMAWKGEEEMDDCTFEFVDPEDDDHKIRDGEWLKKHYVDAKERIVGLKEIIVGKENEIELLEDQIKADAEKFLELSNFIEGQDKNHKKELADKAAQIKSLEDRVESHLIQKEELRKALAASEEELETTFKVCEDDKSVIREKRLLEFDFWVLVVHLIKRLILRR